MIGTQPDYRPREQRMNKQYRVLSITKKSNVIVWTGCSKQLVCLSDLQRSERTETKENYRREVMETCFDEHNF